MVNALSGANVKDVYLLGFADNRGSFEQNLVLSEKRARLVAAKFKPQGVSVHPEGFSYEMPVSDNGTEEGRSKNRRVEVWVPR